MAPNHLSQPFTFGTVPFERPPQQVSADAHAEDSEARPRHLDTQPAVHCERVEPAFGDFYGVCACGSRSLPHVTAREAFEWRCPHYDAAVESVRNARLWQQRVRDASLGDVVR